MFSAFILQLSRLGVSTILYSVILSLFNTLIPMIVRLLVSYEKHYDEGSAQVSLYVKITFFRWVNTAIITRIITPFLVTLGNVSATRGCVCIEHLIPCRSLRFNACTW